MEKPILNKVTISFKSGATKEVIATDIEAETIWDMLKAVHEHPENSNDLISTEISEGKGRLWVFGKDISGLFREPI